MTPGYMLVMMLVASLSAVSLALSFGDADAPIIGRLFALLATLVALISAISSVGI